MTAGDYDTRTSEFKRHVGSGTAPPRALYALAIQADGPEAPAREFELVGVHVVGFGPRVVALDPELDPRVGLRVEGLRGVSLSNFLNHVIGMARSGLPSEPGSHRWIPLRTLDALPRGLDTRLDFERQAIVLAHDFRPANPERKAAHVRTAVAEFVLLQLASGWTLSGRVFNFDAELSKTGETHFLNVQVPKAYGDATRFSWGRDLPFVAVNRQFLVGYVRAETREELEDALRTAPELQPPGYTAEDGA
ncbi:MAG: hypothetical protein ACREKI_07340 [Gemmatimonadota bacterium]